MHDWNGVRLDFHGSLWFDTGIVVVNHLAEIALKRPIVVVGDYPQSVRLEGLDGGRPLMQQPPEIAVPVMLVQRPWVGRRSPNSQRSRDADLAQFGKAGVGLQKIVYRTRFAFF